MESKAWVKAKEMQIFTKKNKNLKIILYFHIKEKGILSG